MLGLFGLSNEVAGWIGAFTASGIAAIYAKRNEIRGKLMEKEVVGEKNEPSIRQMMLEQSEKASTHRIDVIDRLGDLAASSVSTERRLDNMEDRIESIERKIDNPPISGK